jgi:hypothetical protein
MYTDNLLKYTGNYLHPRKSKRYTYTYNDDATIGLHDCFVVHYTNPEDKYDREGTLYIDKKSYGIVIDKDKTKEITFKQIDGKWYLSSTVYNRFTISDKGLNATRIYNVVPPPTENETQYVDKGLLAPHFAKKYTQDFNDEYWEDVNFVSLPEWVITRIQQQKENL